MICFIPISLRSCTCSPIYQCLTFFSIFFSYCFTLLKLIFIKWARLLSAVYHETKFLRYMFLLIISQGLRLINPLYLFQTQDSSLGYFEPFSTSLSFFHKHIRYKTRYKTSFPSCFMFRFESCI